MSVIAVTSATISGLGLGFNVITHLTSKAQNTNGIKKMVLRELRNNIKLLDKRGNSKVNISSIISQLSNSEIIIGLENDFKFNKLAKRKAKIQEKHLIRPYEKKRYIGADANMLIGLIDDKITDLKQIRSSYPTLADSPNNITAKLNNLFFLCVALAILTKE